MADPKVLIDQAVASLKLTTMSGQKYFANPLATGNWHDALSYLAQAKAAGGSTAAALVDKAIGELKLTTMSGRKYFSASLASGRWHDGLDYLAQAKAAAPAKVTSVSIDVSQKPLLRAVTGPIVATVFQWQQGDSSGANFANISGATASSYTIPAGSSSSYRVVADGVTSAVYGIAPASSAYWTWSGDNLTTGNNSTLPQHWSDSDPTPIDPAKQALVSNGRGGTCARLTISSTSPANPSGGLMANMANPAPFVTNLASGLPYTQPGKDSWYRAQVRFPTGYVPVTGVWNIHVEWHTEYYGSSPAIVGKTAGALNSFFGVRCDGPTGSPGTNPRLCFELRGGQITNTSGTFNGNVPQYDILTDLGALNSLQYDYWYDLLFHWVWQPTATGSVEVYVDGALAYSRTSFPTLCTWPDGTVWPNGWGIYNYRRADITTTSIIDYDLVAIGPTRASVGG